MHAKPAKPPRRGKSGIGSLGDKTPTIVAMVLFWAAALSEYQWPWGIMFLAMSIPALISGESHFVQTVTKRDNPVLFYVVVWSFIITSVTMILIDVWPLFD